MSFVGQTIYKMDGNDYFTSEMRVRGIGAVFSMNVINIVGSPTVTATVQTRALSSTAFTDVVAFDAITSTGIKMKSGDALEYWVRIKFAFAAGDDATDGIHVEVAAPAWRWYA